MYFHYEEAKLRDVISLEKAVCINSVAEVKED